MTSENIIGAVGSQLGGISFDKREKIMYIGVLVLLESLLEDYLDEGQIETMAQMLRRLRKRPADIAFSEDMCLLHFCVVGFLASNNGNEIIPNNMLIPVLLKLERYSVFGWGPSGQCHVKHQIISLFPLSLCDNGSIVNTLLSLLLVCSLIGLNPVEVTSISAS